MRSRAAGLEVRGGSWSADNAAADRRGLGRLRYIGASVRRSTTERERLEAPPTYLRWAQSSSGLNDGVEADEVVALPGG